MYTFSCLSRRLSFWGNAIRDGFVSLLPLTLVGAFANVVAYTPYESYVQWMAGQFGAGWQRPVVLLIEVTIGVMGLLGTMSIAIRTSLQLREKDGQHHLSQAAIAAAAASSFLLVVRPTSVLEITTLGYASIFTAILVGIASAELMHLYSRWLPQHDGLRGLEPGVPLQESIRLSGHAILVLLSITGLNMLWLQIQPSFLALLHGFGENVCQQGMPPFGLNALFVLINQLLWSAGINGGQVILNWGALGAKCIAPASTVYSDMAATPAFMNAFAHLGGAGATWGLILACLLTSKDKALRVLAWHSIFPAILNVNELLLFGIPLVFGRALLWPFLMAPLASGCVAMIGIHAFGIPMTGQAVIWSTPIFISGYLMSGSWMGGAVQLLGLLSSAAIYYPFLRRLEQSRHKQQVHMLKSALDEMMAPVQASMLLDRADNVGDVARGLLRDFRVDLHSERVFLVYQPQHDIQGNVVGVEALLRWNHATHGSIPPAAIVNIAEECHAIHEIGEMVVNQACRDLAGWRAQGHCGFKVAINMSPVQLENPSWVQQIARALKKHDIHPSQLEVEITEGRMMSSTQASDRTLVALQELGVPLSMDDFGMGCTSLLYMQRFRMHAIKLDGQLTRTVLGNAVNQDIIRSVTRLGRSRHVHVVAEFVETLPQRDLLLELGCDYFQGWLYSPAMPASELPAYLNKQPQLLTANA